MDGAPVGCRSGEQQCRIVVSLQGPDPYGFGLDPFEVPEIVEEVGTAIGYRPAQGILVIAMCNQRIDHCLIARLALHLAQQFDAYIDMGGTLTPPLPPAVKKEDGTYVPWFDLVTLDDIRTFLADLPGRVWEISGEDDVRRTGLLAVARRRRHLPRRLGAPSAFPYDQVNGSSMPMSEDFHQLALRFRDPIQHDYEVIRPVMLADEPIAVRSRETGIDRTTVSEKAKRFLQRGMLGLVDQRTTTAKGRQEYPDVVAGYILYLKQLYPPIHDHEIVRIIARKYGYTTNHVTVRRFLDRHPIPVQLPLPLMGFHQFEDAYRARWTVVRLFYEGWHKTSIAGCLGLSRKHVWHILKAFERDGFAGLEDQRTQRHPPPATQLTLPFLKEVLAVQREYPRAGRFRVRGLIEQRTGQAPSERTVGRAMAINRQAHGAPPAWSTDRPDVPTADGVLKEMPYDPAWRHRY